MFVLEFIFTDTRFQSDLDDLAYIDGDSEDEADDANTDLLAVERKRRNQDTLRRRAGEPEKPVVKEILKMNAEFLERLRQVLA